MTVTTEIQTVIVLALEKDAEGIDEIQFSEDLLNALTHSTHSRRS